MEFFQLFIGLVLAYLLGSIPTAVWVGKIFYGVDVRNEGSGNAGATNTIRVLGVKAGLPVFIIDILKGFFAVWLMQYFVPANWDPDNIIYANIAAGLLAVVGHTLPVFAGFRGGKGVATLLGMGIALFGGAVLVSVIIFILVVSITRFVSLGSLLAGIAFPLVVIFYYHEENPGLIFLSIFAAIFLVWTHRKNIGRLLKGNENKFSFKKQKANK
ncbi:MAG TPA: glycerol-3-phosphate 1-O-acyltransferase PlsY [Bacteroidales bacterium]